jgi:hypothetical protein
MGNDPVRVRPASDELARKAVAAPASAYPATPRGLGPARGIV